MRFIYYAGPVDFALHDGKDVLASVRERLAKNNHVIYNATSVFQAGRVDRMGGETLEAVVEVHHEAIRNSDAMLADLRGQSVGIPIEMWEACKRDIPVYVLVSEQTKNSLYVHHIIAESDGMMSEDPDALLRVMLKSLGRSHEESRAQLERSRIKQGYDPNPELADLLEEYDDYENRGEVHPKENSY